MCKKRNSVELKLPDGSKIRIDPCMREKILQLNKNGFKTVACCCGHGVYPESIVFEDTIFPEDYEPYIYFVKTGEHSSLYIPRTRRFYKKDAKGFYYIPEIVSSEKRGEKKDA